MRAHDFTAETLIELVRAGLASAQTERIVAGGHTIEVARVRIIAGSAGAREAQLKGVARRPK